MQRDLTLPLEEENAGFKKCLGLDYGGTLVKMVCINDNNELEFECVEGFQKIRDSGTLLTHEYVGITGGGAYKYYNEFLDVVKEGNCKLLERVNEMTSIVRGMNYLLHRDLLKVYCLKSETLIPATKVRYPYLLMNIGSGVSIVKVSGDNDYERVTGTCLGGGTALGLAHVVTGVRTFDELLELSSKGTGRLDATVADIQGDAVADHKFPSDTVVSSFGKLYMDGGMKMHNSQVTFEDDSDDSSNDDFDMKSEICRSTVYMISYNLGYLGVLVAQLANCNRIIFSGKYVATHEVTLRATTYAVEFCQTHYMDTRKSIEVNFMPGFDGYVGALGALLTINDSGTK